MFNSYHFHSGVKGQPPTDTLKLGRTKLAGFRSMMTIYFGGKDCQAKAFAVGNALEKRIETELVARGLGEFTRSTMTTTPPLGVAATECVFRWIGKLDINSFTTLYKYQF